MSEARANGSGGRPLSPHMQVWRWHITMLGSILHRATGVALYAGALIATGWAASLAAGPDAYQGYCGLLGSPLGKLVLIGLTFSAFYHMANGVRHLFWDSGRGFVPSTANATTAAVIAFGVVATVAVWAYVLLSGAA
ncbi:MAG: succinate dehydrogenase, cytochrome b556 subunit [Caulobacteraceae bacterium]|nr:succinate dehydrogenase, cytochrome b556 subunit [Caulobacteraceae bacterium]